MFCQKCGGQVNDDSIFCSKCGAEINKPINNSTNASFPTSWKCIKCGEFNKGERQNCISCGEIKPTLSSDGNNYGIPWYCQNCGNKNYEHYSYCTKCLKPKMIYGSGTNIWIIICLILGILGVIADIYISNSLNSNSMYKIYDALGGKDLINGWVYAFHIFDIGGYFILKKFENKLGVYAILLSIASTAFYMISLGGFSLLLLLLSSIKHIITFLVIKKYWRNMDGIKELMNRFSK